MKTQQKINEYLQFSRKDRIAILIIASILLTAFLLPSFLNRTIQVPTTNADTAWISALSALEKPAQEATPLDRNERKSDGEYKYDRTEDRYNNGQQAQLFSFDPNTLDDAGWKRLGIREKTVSTIRRYIEKGGRFKQPADLLKIYGLRSDQAERLIPYIKISGKDVAGFAPNASPAPPASGNAATYPSPKTSRAIMAIDINTADSLAFESLPGIGPTLASRIIRFREKLGGFYAIKQVSETFGISDSIFSVIKPYLRIDESYSLQKIRINTVDVHELRKHPYLKYSIATAIINYRTQHGFFNSAEDLKHLSAIDASLLEKLTPYIIFSQ